MTAEQPQDGGNTEKLEARKPRPQITSASPAKPLSTDEERHEAHAVRRTKLETVLQSWSTQAEEERNTRRYYAYWLLGFLGIQAALLNLAFFLMGAGLLTVDEWTARVFMVGTFAELSAMVYWIVKYLFSRNDQAVLELIEKL